MKKSKGEASPKEVKDLILELINKNNKEVDRGKYVEDYKKAAMKYREKYEAKCKEYDKLKRLAEKIALECYIQTELKYELLNEKEV